MPSDRVAEPAFEERGVPFREAKAAAEAGMSANERISARVQRRPGAEVDARAIRTGLGMSQPVFSKAFGIPLATLRDWEQGRNHPEGATRVFLMTIAHRPDAVREALEAYG